MCKDTIPANKRWGLFTLCHCCDESQDVPKSLGVTIADGKTDYHIQVIRNPSPQDAQMIRRVGRAWDPRSQLTAINKVSS